MEQLELIGKDCLRTCGLLHFLYTVVTFFKLHDKKTVCLASNFHGTEISTIQKKDGKGKMHNNVALTLIKDYNNYMRGVADQLLMELIADQRNKPSPGPSSKFNRGHTPSAAIVVFSFCCMRRKTALLSTMDLICNHNVS